MELKHYDNINGKYSEVMLFNEYEALFFDGRIDRNTLPAGSFLYEISHDDEDWSQPEDFGYRILANFFGTVITYKPIHVPADGFRQMMNTDFEYGCKFVKPDEVDEWLYKMNAKDNSSRRVLAFIENFRKKGMLSGISEEQFSELYREHLPYHFACMLKSTFNRGEVYIALPSKKIVWRDNDNRYYNVDGQFYRSGAVYAEIGRTVDDAYYVDSNNINGISIGPVSKYVKKAYDMMGKYKSKFPNR